MANNIPQITHAEFRNILRASLYTPGYGSTDTDTVWGLNLLVIGDPGVGKTSGIVADARASGLSTEVLVGAITDPTDYGGVPTAPADGGRFVQALLPTWLERLDQFAQADEGAVLVLDELTCVPQAQQAAMLRLILERYCGPYKLHRKLRIVAAANPVEQAAGGQPLSMPMANRFGQIEVEPADLDTWFDVLDGARAVQPLNPAALEAEVLRSWGAEYERARILARAFLRRRPELAQRTPKAGSPEAEQPWPSHRTWEFAMRALASARVHKLTEAERDVFIGAFVGVSTAAEFTHWLREADLPEAEDVLDHRVTWTPNPMRPDRTGAVLDACAACVLNTADRQIKVARARTMWTILAGLVNTPDLGLRATARLSNDDEVSALSEATAAKRAMLEVARATQVGGLRR